MVLANMPFNHDNDCFHEALGVSHDMRTKCRERIFFSAFSNALQRAELFEDEDDAPKDMRTVTGDLQRCLTGISDPLEYEYTLVLFNNTQRIAMKSYAMYKAFQESDNKEDRIKMKILSLLEDMRDSDDDDDDDKDRPIDQINKKTMFKRIKLVKNSHYNFHTYMNMLHREFDHNDIDFEQSKKPDIDSLLNNLFSTDED